MSFEPASFISFDPLAELAGSDEYSSELDGFSSGPVLKTPPPSPERRAAPLTYITPERAKAVRKFFERRAAEDFEERSSSLTRDEHKGVKRGVSDLKDIQDTPGRKKRARSTKKTMDVFLRALVPEVPIGSAQFHREASAMLQISDWMPKTYDALLAVSEGCMHKLPGRVSPSTIFNLQHISSPDAKGGWHFVKTGDAQSGILNVTLINPLTGVYCAQYPLRKKRGGVEETIEKFSTFFPDGLGTEEALMRLLEAAMYPSNRRAREGNRLLCFSPQMNTYVEVFFLRGEDCEHLEMVNSAFPIFSFLEWQAGKKIYEDVPGLLLTDVDVLAYAQRALEGASDGGYSCLRFQMDGGQKLVVDVAALLSFPIGRGVYFAVPSEEIRL